ncbi:undecaprenyl-diphosphate phosphatase [Brucella gallinifaecis]|uniref:Undecaprenyl-diphosphatase n=1 Tax=Brucella gallinifaecis TaxID=215590 RepID=A0A502BP36_9HYPH|nr:undecaprenyl-diphosphate phosphatase [Brucella gallinifaecis]TPF76292.1 undecaprenyl-diphosphate phosphatase [Brucella gallinifaecis]
MEIYNLLEAAFLGLIEGLTEFIPVSSTGHLLLIGHFLGFESTGKTFEVLIQLGAILAILTVYSAKLLKILTDFPRDARTRRFVFGILLAFLPAAIIGAMMHGFIKSVLFETPMLVCIMLILGGFILLWIDQMDLKPRYRDVMDYPMPICLAIGFFQCLAMVPGVSRSGSTIVGALLLGADKRSAAEFSFFLAMPTMAGAFTYDLYKSHSMLSMNDTAQIIIGFIMAFISGVFVVKHLLDYVSRHGFRLFAWWRLIVGSLGMAALLVWG